MNQLTRSRTLLSGLAYLWLGVAATATSQSLDNPLRIPPAASQSQPAPDTTADTSAIHVEDTLELSSPAETIDSQVRQVQYQNAPYRVEGTTPTSVLGGGPPVELGPGEYIVEGGKSAPGDLFYDGTGGDCCGGSGCQQCCLIPCPVFSLDNFEFFSGVHGFTGPRNRGRTGSFGFHTGFNWGAPVPCSGGSVGAQLGLNAAFSNFSGADFTDDDRSQVFVTGGLFRRVDWGLQGGAVIDYLSDRWYSDVDLVQLRGEFSWMFPCTHELGFWFSTNTQDDTSVSMFTGTTAAISETWRATDLNAFFYRHRFADGAGANARIYAGFTGQSDGLIGGDLRIPLNCDLALEAGFAYLIPDDATTGTVGGGHEHESWNVALTLVWYPGCRQAVGNDYYRPLFNVANNGSFMVTRQ